MMPPAPLSTEAERLAALHSYQVLDTASEAAFDDLVALAARLTGSPIALVSLVDADRQWFKARHGLNVQETPRDHAFCAVTVLSSGQPLVVEDTTADPRFRNNPFVTGAPEIRAYLGVPLIDAEGFALGSLCVIDRVPRPFDADAVDSLRTLARAVVANLELRRALLRTREAALTDSLTGLPNRRAVTAALAAAAMRSDPLAVIAVDLDHFKEVNDGEGHAAGDALLRVAADRLRAAVRPGDMVGRTGGDEFVVLLAGPIKPGDLAAVAQRICTSLNQPVHHGARQLRLGATLGVATMPGDAAAPEMALRVADEALLRAKRDGRGGVGHAGRDDAARLLHAAAILRAFEADDAPHHPPGGALPGAAAHLQPIVSLRHAPGTAPPVIAVEALARWTHPAVGAIAPAELFAVIGPERASHLGQVVRERALAAFAALRRSGLAEARIALNLSASEVCRADIALHIAEQVERAGLSLRSVEVEITEEILLDRISDRTLDQLAALRGRGARLVLDDFGTGRSGLAQLLRVPLDGVKLDKQFVQRLGSDLRAEEIIRASVSLAHGLGLEIVAEGVETEPQAAVLRRLGCDAAQGFLFARPMPPQQLEAWLLDREPEDAPGVVALRPKGILGAG
ncbi:putative bifunctional diguanylate cyclase/phosphodiesterase [Roseomonas sp. BN140053]|uniref:putative bifunctional diguanylate cyclase/phosphodiesterase n=1 Tax=Roseomonas sp. BN140053 TaxID=3391898 RepID=UPI0039E97635